MMRVDVMEWARSRDLSRVAKLIDDSLMNSIRIRCTAAHDDSFETCRSKIGGAPDLLHGVDWPLGKDGPMAFVAQLNMQEVSHLDTAKVLPPKGVLHFFYDNVAQRWGFGPDDYGGWRVLYSIGDPRQFKRTDPPPGLPEESRFLASSADFSNEWTLPPIGSLQTERMRFTNSETWAYIDMLNDLSTLYGSDEQINRLIGHPDATQGGGMQVECQLASNGLDVGSSSGYADPRVPELKKGADDWIMLLQMDSENESGMMWGDMGRIFYWIRKQDLARLDFTKVWLVLQCS